MDLGALLRDYRKHWYWFVISLFVCGLAGLFVISRHKDRYTVSASMLIEENEDKSDMNSYFDVSTVFGGGSNVDDEVLLVSSHSTYKDVSRQLGLDIARFRRDGIMNATRLYEEYPVDVVAPPLYGDTTRYPVAFKIKINDKGLANIRVKDVAMKETLLKLKDKRLPVKIHTYLGDFTVVPTKYYNPEDPEVTMYIIAGSHDGAAEELSEDVSAGIASKKANMIKLNYETEDPDFGKKLLNSLIDHYNAEGIAHKNLQSQNTIKFLDERIALLLGQIRSNDDQIRDFKEDKGIMDIYSEGQYNLGLRGSLDNNLFHAETQLEIMKMAREFITTPGNEYALVPYQNVSTADNPQANDGLNELVNTYNTLVLERMQIASTAKHNNVALKKISDQLDALRANIIVTMNKVAESAEIAVRELRTQRNEAQRKLTRFPQQEHDFINIRRDRELLNSLYTFLLQKREETSIMLANTVAKGRIIDEAYQLREPVSMSKKMIMALALLVGLFLPMVGIYLLNIFRTKLVSREEIEDASEAPVLGEVCTSRSGKNLVVTPGSTSSAAELFKLIRTNLQFVLNGKNQKVVLVTSSRPGEGKSFISINTAAALAMTGKRVVLVGMDIRKPRLAEYLNLAPHAGVTAYLASDDMPVSDIIIRDALPVKGLDVIVAGIVPPNPSELLLLPRVDELFATLREQYDYIIIDSAPLGIVSDTLTLARIADASIYVTRLNVTTKKDMRYINSIYDNKRLPRLGVVVNGTESYHRYGYGEGEAHNRRNKD